MARKNGANENGSLELFLDTLTNTFGAIVFIFLMVSLQLNIARQATPARQDSRERLAYLRTADQLEGVEAEIAHAERDISELGDRFRALVSERADEQFEEFVKVQEEVQAIQKRLHGFAPRTKEQDQQSLEGALQEQLAHNAEVKAQIRDMQREIESPGEPARQERIPRMRSVPKKAVPLLLVRKRIYFILKYTNFGDTVGPDQTEVRAARSGGNEWEICPQPSGGFPVGRTERFADYWRSRFTKRFRSESFAAIIWVLPDSYEEAEILKERLMADGLDYNMIPEAPGPCITIPEGGGDTIVQ